MKLYVTLFLLLVPFSIHAKLDTPENLSAQSDSPTTVKIQWIDTNGTESGHELYRRQVCSNCVYGTITTLPANSVEYIDTNLKPSTTYEYKVAAFEIVDGKKNYSRQTKRVIVKTLAPPQPTPTPSATPKPTPSAPPPAAPANFRATPVSSSQITLRWDDLPDETGYRLYRSQDNISYDTIEIGQNIDTFEDTGLLSNTTYYYRLLAYDQARTSAETLAFATSFESPPQSPTNFSASSPSSSEVQLNWTDVATETNYSLERAIQDASGNPGPYTLVSDSISENTTTYLDRNLVGGKIYFYKLYAVNGVGRSQSAELSLSTQTPITNTLTIDNPTQNSSLSGLVQISATGSSQVTNVQFFLSGYPISSVITSAPFNASWNSDEFPNGEYFLTAKGKQDGNSVTSPSVKIIVNNALNQTGPFDFTFKNPGPQNIIAGGEVTLMIPIKFHGTPQKVEVSKVGQTAGWPIGLLGIEGRTCSDSCVARVRIYAYPHLDPQTQSIGIQMRSQSGIIKTLNFDLNIIQPEPITTSNYFNYTVKMNESNLRGVTQGQNIEYNLAISRDTGNPSPVTVTGSVAPRGLQFSYENNPCVPNPTCLIKVRVHAPLDTSIGQFDGLFESNSENIQTKRTRFITVVTPPPYAIPSEGLVARYDLNDKTETKTLSDLSGNGNNAYNYTDNFVSDGIVESAVSIMRNGTAIRVPSSPSFNFGTRPFTVSMWFRLSQDHNSSTYSSKGLFGTYSGGNRIAATLIGSNIGSSGVTGKMKIHFSSHSATRGGEFLTQISSWNKNTWYNLTVVFDRNATYSQVYINGVEDKANLTNLTGGNFDGSHQPTGMWNFGDHFMPMGLPNGESLTLFGDVDEVRIYDHYFNATEIASVIALPVSRPLSLFAIPLAKTTPEIELYWQDVASNETGYIVERSYDEKNGYTQIASLPEGSNFYRDLNVVAGTDYYYRVKTTGSQGRFAYSRVAPSRAVLPATEQNHLVKTIYFVPADKEPLADTDVEENKDKIRVALRMVQHMYALQLWRRGFGYLPVNLEVDPQTGQPIVHFYRGKYAQSHYLGDPNCADGIDNDGDGKTDAADGQCGLAIPDRNETYSINGPKNSWTAEFYNDFNFEKDKQIILSRISPSLGGGGTVLQSSMSIETALAPTMLESLNVKLASTELPAFPWMPTVSKGLHLSGELGGLFHELGHSFGGQHLDGLADMNGAGFHHFSYTFNESIPFLDHEGVVFLENATAYNSARHFHSIPVSTDKDTPVVIMTAPAFVQPGQSFEVKLKTFDLGTGPSFSYVTMDSINNTAYSKLNRSLDNPFEAIFNLTTYTYRNDANDKLFPTGMAVRVGAASWDWSGNTAWPALRVLIQNDIPAPDTVAPSVPQMSLYSLDCNSVRFRWTESVDNLDGYGRRGYIVYRNGQPHRYLDTYYQPWDPQTAIYLTDNPGTTVTFGVSALDFAGNESAQSTLNVQFPSCP